MKSNTESEIYDSDEFIDKYQDKTVLGYDCDGNIIDEFRILRFPFSADIENWDDEPNIDPRFYCLVRISHDQILAVSVYDDYFRDNIRKYEKLNDKEDIPMLIKTVSEMKGYEVAFEGITGTEWYYDRNKDELRKKINAVLKKEKGLVLVKK